MIVKFIGNGMVYKKYNKTGSYWSFEIYYIDEYNKKRRKCFKADTAGAAAQKGQAYVLEMKKEIGGNLPKEALMSFGDFCTMFLSTSCRNQVKESTYIKYVNTLKNNVSDSIKNMRVKDIKPLDVINALNELVDSGYSQSIIKKAYSLINRSFEFYSMITGIVHNPAKAVPIPKAKKQNTKLKYFTLNEMETIREVAVRMTEDNEIKYGMVIVLLAFSGLRAGEALALSWSDVDFESNTIFIHRTLKRETIVDNKINYALDIQNSPKSKNSIRTISMHPFAREALVELKKAQNCDLVVSTENGKLVSSTQINKNLKKVLENCDFDAQNRSGVHSLRHSFATYLFAQGLSSNAVSVYLGHSTDVITKKLYIHDKAEVAKAEWDKSGLFNIN